jgi:hypothetical protein
MGFFFSSDTVLLGVIDVRLERLELSTPDLLNIQDFGEDRAHAGIETSAMISQPTRCNISEDLNLKQIYMSYAFFWVFHWGLQFKCQRFGTICLFETLAFNP